MAGFSLFMMPLVIFALIFLALLPFASCALLSVCVVKLGEYSHCADYDENLKNARRSGKTALILLICLIVHCILTLAYLSQELWAVIDINYVLLYVISVFVLSSVGAMAFVIRGLVCSGKIVNEQIRRMSCGLFAAAVVMSSIKAIIFSGIAALVFSG